VLSDIDIAHRATLRSITDVASDAGIDPATLEMYGPYKAKVPGAGPGAPVNGRYVVVTALTPTPFGEGKTLTAVGLGQALRARGKRAFTCIRQPSLGPVFGIKGGAAGGGYAQVVPMEDLNLHLTGDAHAVSSAHNLCAAVIDNHLYHGGHPAIDPHAVTWRRVVDISDRVLRDTVVGLGGRANGTPRETGWDITAASELMAVLALAEDLADLRVRIGRIVVATSRDGRPITAEDLGVAGAMTVLMRDTVKPTLLQNLDGGPVLVHAGPFANIAQGNNSIIADRVALAHGEYVVTESGFGADMGFEKFMNIKCRASGLRPDCAVLVCTVRALKVHSGRYDARPGVPPDPGLVAENLDALTAGLDNLRAHVDIVHGFGVPVVVAVNRFATDTDAEHALVCEAAREMGAHAAVSHTMHGYGAPGGIDLADAVISASALASVDRLTYGDDTGLAEKIEAVATGVYGAAAVEFSPTARRAIELYAEMGYATLPVCMAKTHLSLSHDPALKGRPSGWVLPVRDIRLSAGAGFFYALCGDVLTMPGLPLRPAASGIDIDADGNVKGLF